MEGTGLPELEFAHALQAATIRERYLGDRRKTLAVIAIVVSQPAICVRHAQCDARRYQCGHQRRPS